MLQKSWMIQAFIDFKLFENKPYTGATILNFFSTGVVPGTLIVANHSTT